VNAVPVAVRIRSTGHTGITVSDLDRAVRFYRDVLGCRVSDPVRLAGPQFESLTGVAGCRIDVVFARLPDHVIELLCYRNPPGRTSGLRPCDPGFMHVCLKVADLAQVLERVRAADFVAVGPIQVVAAGPLSGLKAVYVRDPDGVFLELIEEPPGVSLEGVHFK
jgi:glyoxylase I family protein